MVNVNSAATLLRGKGSQYQESLQLSVQDCSLLSTPISIPSSKRKKRTRKKPAFIATKYIQNAIILKQNLKTKHLKTDSFLLMYDIFL